MTYSTNDTFYQFMHSLKPITPVCYCFSYAITVYLEVCALFTKAHCVSGIVPSELN